MSGSCTVRRPRSRPERRRGRRRPAIVVFDCRRQTSSRLGAGRAADMTGPEARSTASIYRLQGLCVAGRETIVRPRASPGSSPVADDAYLKCSRPTANSCCRSAKKQTKSKGDARHGQCAPRPPTPGSMRQTNEIVRSRRVYGNHPRHHLRRGHRARSSGCGGAFGKPARRRGQLVRSFSPKTFSRSPRAPAAFSMFAHAIRRGPTTGWCTWADRGEPGASRCSPTTAKFIKAADQDQDAILPRNLARCPPDSHQPVPLRSAPTKGITVVDRQDARCRGARSSRPGILGTRAINIANRFPKAISILGANYRRNAEAGGSKGWPPTQ